MALNTTTQIVGATSAMSRKSHLACPAKVAFLERSQGPLLAPNGLPNSSTMHEKGPGALSTGGATAPADRKASYKLDAKGQCHDAKGKMATKAKWAA
jgi:hypothetical protein